MLSMSQSAETTTTEDDESSRMLYRNTYNKIIRDLRDHWQSPIMYLKKRGYLPDLKTVMAQKPKRYQPKTDYIDYYDSSKRGQDSSDVSQLDEQLYKDMINKPEELQNYNYVERSANEGFFSNMKNKLIGFFASKKTEDPLEQDDISRTQEDKIDEPNLKDKDSEEKDRDENDGTKSELKSKDVVKNFINDEDLPLDSAEDKFSRVIDTSGTNFYVHPVGAELINRNASVEDLLHVFFLGPLRGDFLGDRMALTTFDSFSGEGEEPAAELRRDEDDLTFVSK
uniref:Uncharacterized protein n=1 Tax=Glossina pallidipes TaxID=7398 RepID=A0A1A9ZUY9_GLOPL